MKPVKITLEAFGPYLKKTQIDLQKLGTNGLYLITGNTGSGKTTIFDAISYALFGSPSGTDRKSSMMRCNYAGPQNPTYVELEFEYRKAMYTVRRNPEYIGLKKVGEGTKTIPQNASLVCPDGKEFTGATDVTKEIENLLGINQSQFSQIAMIAQGNFQEILFADTTKRIPIFRNLFKTEKYEALQNRLNEEAKKAKDEFEKNSTSYNETILNFVCSPDSVLSIDLDKAQKEEMPFEEKYSLFQKIIEEDKKLKEKYAKEQKDLDEETAQVIKEIAKAEEINKAFTELEKTTQSLQEEEKINLELKKNFEELKKSEGLIKELENKAAVILDKMDNYTKLSQKEDTKKELQERLKNNNEKKTQDDKTLLELQNKKTEAESLLKTLDKTGENVLKLEQEIQDLEDKKSQFDSIKEKLINRVELKKELELSQKEYIKNQELFRARNAEYTSIKELFMNNLAGIISSQLKDNEPCPVCGSLTHDNPCKPSSKEVSKESVENAETQAKAAGEKAEKSNQAAIVNKSNLENLEKQLLKEIKDLFGQDESKDFDELSKKTEEELKKNEESLNAVQENLEKEKEKKAQKERLEKSMPEILSSITEKTEEITLLSNQILQDETTLKSLTAEITDLKKTLSYESKQEAENAIQEIQNEVKQKKEQILNAEEEYKKSSKKIDEYNGTKKILLEQTSGKQKIELESLNAKKDVLDKENQELDSKKQEVFSRLENNNTQLTKLSKVHDELLVSEKKHNMISSLDKTARAQLVGKKTKMHLETYVQITFLEKVIGFANERLKIMTDGQYELIRKEEGIFANQEAGLDIDVIDHYNGGIRSVKSLSGGESFQASLALALGLSDVVRHSSNGIKIDTMFIDEGFGTLDTETLQKAFKALVSLTEGTERLIGIISHVDLLKEKIKKQICVTKSGNGGSSIQIIT